jgi:hypothetical protein
MRLSGIENVLCLGADFFGAHPARSRSGIVIKDDEGGGENRSQEEIHYGRGNIGGDHQRIRRLRFNTPLICATRAEWRDDVEEGI